MTKMPDKWSTTSRLVGWKRDDGAQVYNTGVSRSRPWRARGPTGVSHGHLTREDGRVRTFGSASCAAIAVDKKMASQMSKARAMDQLIVETVKEAVNLALETAAKLCDLVPDANADCESLQPMDPETGMRECSRESRGGCLCAERCETADDLATAIRALKQ